MQNVYLQIARYIISIRFFPSELPFVQENFIEIIRNAFTPFLIKERPEKIDFIVDVKDGETMSTLKNEDGKSTYINFYKEISKKHISCQYHLGFSLFQTMLKIVLVELANPKNTLILHCSAAQIKNRGVLFLGQSGAGKSTTISLLQKSYRALCDDIAIIKKEQGKYFLYQTPFIEKNQLMKRSEEKLLLGAVVFLHQSKKYQLHKNKNHPDILNKFTPQIHVMEKSDILLQQAANFVYKNDFFYDLYFGKNEKMLTNLIQNDLHIN